MAFITRDSTCDSSDSTIPPSFISALDDDPYLTRKNSVHHPDVRRNILLDINNAESTVLPPPPEKESLKVFLRVKPKTEEETEIAISEGVEEADFVKIESEYQIALTAPKDSKTFKNCINGTGKMMYRYTFTKIFNPDVGQNEIFSTVVEPRLKDFLEGQNQLLFTYGATSAGKTYTIQGTVQSPGLMPMALDTLFTSIEGKQSSNVYLRPVGYNRVVSASEKDLAEVAKEKEAVFKLGLDLLKQHKSRPDPPSSANSTKLSQASSTMSSASQGISMDSLDLSELHNYFPNLVCRNRNTSKLNIKDSDITYTVWISFAEIYNESIYDLLEKIPEAKKKGEKVKRPVLKLSQDKDGSTYIKDIKEIQVSSADEAYQILMIGRENLQFAATKLNHQSSRSHCIFTVKLIRVADPLKPQYARVSMLSFCDLAGSERISKTQNVGARQKEAGNINTSLLVLGRCIKAIRHNQAVTDTRKQQLIPFRESKLTRLIKTFFSGMGKASLVVCVSQAPYLFDESVHVMKFASIASKITVEQYKAPPPPPAMKTRFSTILAREGKKSFASSILSGRGSIPWEPSSRSTMITDFNRGKPRTARSTMCPQEANLSEVSETDEQEDNERTLIESDKFYALWDIVEELKQKLIEERKKNRTLESNLREELCNEFNQLLVEVEENYEQRIERERAYVEERSEWRIQELEKAYNKQAKRKRTNSSSGFDEREMKLVAVENKLDERDKEIAALKEELSESAKVQNALKETVKSTQETQNRLQEQNSSLQFQLAEQQRVAAETGRELSSTRDRLDVEQKLNMEKLENEETQISKQKMQITKLMNDLAKKDEECTDMRNLLQEAGDEFLSKQEEVEKLQNEIKELENQVTQQTLLLEDVEGQLEESHVLLRELYNQLDDKDNKLEEVEEENEQLKERINSLENENQDLSKKMNVEVEKCSTTQKFFVDVKAELEEKEQELERLKQGDSGERIQALQHENQQLIQSRTKLTEQLADLQSEKMSRSQEIEVNIYLDELKNDLAQSEKINTDLKEQITKLKSEKQALKEEVENYKMKPIVEKLDKSLEDSILGEHEEELFKLQNQVTALTDENIRLGQEQETLLKEQEEQIQEKENLLQQQQKHQQEIKRLKEELEQAGRNRLENKDMSMVETKDFEIAEQLMAKEQENDELKRKLSVMSDEVENLRSELNTLEATQKQETVLQKKLTSLEANAAKERESFEEKLSVLEANAAKEKESFEEKLSTLEANAAKEKESYEEKLSTLESNATKENEPYEEKLSTLKANAAKEKEYYEEKLSTFMANAAKEKEIYEEKLSTLKANVAKEKEDLVEKVANLEAKATKEKEALQERFTTLEAIAAKEKEDLQEKITCTSAKAVEEKKELEKRISIMTDKLNEKSDSEGKAETTKIIELEGRTGSLEKEVGTKDKYIQELEDIIVEKEFRISELEKKPSIDSVDSASKKEEIEHLKKEKVDLEKRLEVMQRDLMETRGEIKVLRRATKDSAVQKNELIEEKEKAANLQKELERNKVLLEAKSREEQALEMLREEMKSKGEEIRSLQEEVEYLKATEEAKDYDIKKAKEERDKLMSHYETLFKKKQQELDSIKQRNNDSAKLHEAIAKATPTKTSGNLKELTNRLYKFEQENAELKSEISQLSKIQEESKAAHEREIRRLKKSSGNVSSRPGSSESGVAIRVTDASTLEADDSKSENSFIEVTPVVKRSGRGRSARGRSTRSRVASSASQASFEDSNTENEPEPGSRSTSRIERKPRVAKNSRKNVSFQEAHNPDRSTSRKRPLKEKQLLSPVREAGKAASRGSDSDFLTPATMGRKKRRLYSNTPQVSEVFTPPTDSENADSPHSVVKRQLRSRRSRKV